MATSHQQASVRISREQAPLAESLMRGQGALAVSLTDVADTPIWEPGLNEMPLWEEVTVTGLFPAALARSPVDAALALLTREPLAWEELPERAWERAWMDRFEPMPFGRRLWIVPSGMSCPDPRALQLHLDPGLAFGTGTHPTTRLCLEWIDAANLDGRTVLDFGCGSGVLGIAARLCGAGRVLCVDNDPQAIAATRDNAARNGIEIEARIAPLETGPEAAFDVCIANILSGILIEHAALLMAALRPGGDLVLAGVMAEQQEQVLAAYATRGLDVLSVQQREDWVRIHGVRA